MSESTVSMLQLEIMHGVLNDVNLHKERSFFYLRNKVDELDLSADDAKVRNEWCLSHVSAL